MVQHPPDYHPYMHHTGISICVHVYNSHPMVKQTYVLLLCAAVSDHDGVLHVLAAAEQSQGLASHPLHDIATW